MYTYVPYQYLTSPSFLEEPSITEGAANVTIKMEAETADEKTDQMNDLNLQAKEKDKSSQQPSPQTFKGRNATKLPNSPLRRLQYREVCFKFHFLSTQSHTVTDNSHCQSPGQ